MATFTAAKEKEGGMTEKKLHLCEQGGTIQKDAGELTGVWGGGLLLPRRGQDIEKRRSLKRP